MKLTRDAFCDLRHKAQQALRRSKETPSVLICAGTGCIAGGALKIYENLKNECESRALHNLLMLYRLVWQPKLHRMLGMH